MFREFKSYKHNLVLLFVIILAVFVTFTSIYLNSTQLVLGNSYRDVYFYLIEALRFSGVEITGYAYIDYLSPFVPFLTSIIFRLGFVSEISIFIVSGIFYFFGVLGFYYLLKLRFKPSYALFGVFLYATLSINLKWVGNGTLDIPFIALMIWSLYFFIQGMEKNQKYFYLAFPLGVLCFFTKYQGVFVFAVMVLYFLSRTNIARNIVKYFKNIVGGIIAGIIISLPFFTYYFIYEIPLGFLNQAQEISSEASAPVTHGGQVVVNDLFFYVRRLVYDISGTNYFIGILVLILLVLGIIAMIYTFKNTFKGTYSKLKNSPISVYKWKVPSKLVFLALVASILLIVLSFFTAGAFSVVYSEIILLLGLFVLAYTLSKILISYEDVDSVWNCSYPYLAFNITMFGLFFVYFVFFSSHLTKADRYFTSMAPGFVYIVVLAIEILFSKFKDYNIKGVNFKHVILVVVIALMLISTLFYFNQTRSDSLVEYERETADWITDNNLTGIIYSDRGPIYTWYLQEEIKYAQNLPAEDLNQQLLDGNASYYIRTNSQIQLENYEIINKIGDVTIYERI